MAQPYFQTSQNERSPGTQWSHQFSFSSSCIECLTHFRHSHCFYFWEFLRCWCFVSWSSTKCKPNAWTSYHHRRCERCQSPFGTRKICLWSSPSLESSSFARTAATLKDLYSLAKSFWVIPAFYLLCCYFLKHFPLYWRWHPWKPPLDHRLPLLFPL